jgi:UDP-3-O-[3-hydroxymyristoyl] glucosamine N-acyltransferase
MGEIKEENITFLGYPAIEYKQFFKSTVVFKDLPEMVKKIRDLENEIETLKKR